MIDTMAMAAGLLGAKLDPAGEVAWARGFTGSASYPNGIAIAPNGDVVVVGRLDGTLSFGGSSLISAGSDGFIIKLAAATGEVAQAKLVSGSANTAFEDWDGLNAVTVDGMGSIYVAGHFAGSSSPCGTVRTSAGNWDVFVARYNGVTLLCDWDRVFGSTEQDLGSAIATDGVGVFVGINSFGSLNAGGGSLPATGVGNDIIMARYLASVGTHSWSLRFDGGTVKALAAGDGGVFAAGTLSAPISFGGGTIGTAGSQDIFAVRFNAGAGGHVWSKAVPGGASTDSVTSLVFANDGVHLAGAISGPGSLGGPALASGGGAAAAYNLPNGTHLSSFVLGSDIALSTPSLFGVVTVGTFTGTTMIGGQSHTSSGGSDIFVMRE